MPVIRAIGQAILKGIALALWKYLMLQRRIQERHKSIDEQVQYHLETMEFLMAAKDMTDEQKDRILIDSARRIVHGT